MECEGAASAVVAIGVSVAAHWWFLPTEIEERKQRKWMSPVRATEGEAELSAYRCVAVVADRRSRRRAV